MKNWKHILIAFAFAVSMAYGQGGDHDGHDHDGLKERPALFQKDGKTASFAFDMPLVGISDPGMLLAHFSSRPLLVFYFSAKCPHCMRAYPKVQKVLDKYGDFGLTGVAVASGQNRKSDIRVFMENQKVTVPVFMDKQQQFSRNYGTGYVPVLFIVKENGEFIRYGNVTAETLAYLEEDLDQRFLPKSK